MSERLKITNTSEHNGYVNLIAEKDGENVGRSIALMIGSTMFLEDFRVIGSERNQGVGSALLEKTETLSKQVGARSITRVGVFCEADSIPAYVGAIKFFKKRGYKNRIITLSKKLVE